MPAFQGEGLGRTFVRELLERNHERVVVRAASGRYVGHDGLELFYRRSRPSASGLVPEAVLERGGFRRDEFLWLFRD